jgi:hypothetical protein
MNFSSRFGLRNANRVRGRIETIIAKNVDVDDKDFRNPAEFTALHEQAGRPPRNNPNYKSNEKTSPDMFIAKLLERKCCENLQREPLHPDFHPMVRDKRHQKRQRSNDGKSGPRGPRPVPSGANPPKASFGVVRHPCARVLGERAAADVRPHAAREEQ